MRSTRATARRLLLAAGLLACGSGDRQPPQPAPRAAVAPEPAAPEAPAGEIAAAAPATRSGALEAESDNRPPVVASVRLEPEKPVASSDLTALALAEDPDGDALEYLFWWRVNGELLETEDGPRLPSRWFRRGDRVDVTVTALDGRHRSESLTSEPVAIANSAPVITSQPGHFGDDGVFRYALQTRDTDGDRRLRFRLRRAPEGMQIDALSGLVSWLPDADQAGEHAVEVEVDDQHGGTAVQHFRVQVAFAEVPGPAAPEPEGR